MRDTIKAFIKRDNSRYIAECLELEAVAQGDTLDDTVENLRLEVCRCLQGSTPSLLGLSNDPTMFIILEDVPLASSRTDC